MLERTWRTLLLVAAALFLVIGIPFFLAPDWAASEFPWRVGPFLAQTIGGWSLGTAAIAAHAAYFARPRRIYPLLIYSGLFGMGQLVVVVAFADKLQTGHLLTYPYLGGLLALVGASLAVGYSWLKTPPGTDNTGQRPLWWARVLVIVVGGFVALLALGAFIAGPDGTTARGEVFPEAMGLFSIRAFCAFLFALTMAILSALLSRDLAPYRALTFAGLYLVLPITLAALLNLSRFSFSLPGTMLYLLAYVIIGLLLIAMLAYERVRPDAFKPR